MLLDNIECLFENPIATKAFRHDTSKIKRPLKEWPNMLSIIVL